MPTEIHTSPLTPAEAGTTAADGASGVWAWVGGPLGFTITALTAALIGFALAWLILRKPATTDASKRLMYVPLLLVNGAAVYGQVAFFYENVAPATWATPGKLTLAAIIAAAIESISVYVGWHAHDALLNKAGNTAARLRRASYVIAAFVASINYAHFATFGPDNTLGLNAAAAAFGLLSLLSPWLWGLHTRRMQHVQLRKEGVVDAAGATFSGERIRSFPLRAYLARRWSIDNYVTDPRQAWEGYNTALQSRWSASVDNPGWWMHVNPVARVRQLAGALAERTTKLEQTASELTSATERITTAEKAAADLRARLDTTSADLAQVASERDAHLRQVEQLGAELASTSSLQASEVAALRAAVAKLEEENDALRADHQKRLKDASAKDAETIRSLRQQLAEATVPNIADHRNRTSGGNTKSPSKVAPKPRLSDEDAVQRLLDTDGGVTREWTQSAIVTALEVGWSRAPRLLEAVVEEQRRRATEGDSEDQAVNQ
jgi:hypothetical protein